ncbi:MAG TPA: response regulator [Chitinophagaceae bacterium]|jgi:DNA-binding response OmpR family regulator|nr:response regulator [Chitinophagaceae bacterium]
MDILIVDDEKDLCNILTSICIRKNFTVSCAFNLLDALVQIESFPLLMFLDNNLADGEGLELVEQLKVRSPLTKIVFITASSDLKIRDQAFIRGVDYFLAKPFQLQGVREILSQMQHKRTKPTTSFSSMVHSEVYI